MHLLWVGFSDSGQVNKDDETWAVGKYHYTESSLTLKSDEVQILTAHKEHVLDRESTVIAGIQNRKIYLQITGES